MIAALEILERRTNIYIHAALEIFNGAGIYWERAAKLLKHLALHTLEDEKVS